jgi:hypothetical protein
MDLGSAEDGSESGASVVRVSEGSETNTRKGDLQVVRRLASMRQACFADTVWHSRVNGPEETAGVDIGNERSRLLCM